MIRLRRYTPIINQFYLHQTNVTTSSSVRMYSQRMYSQSGSFKKKEQALENQYAKQEDKKLIEKLKEKLFGIVRNNNSEREPDLKSDKPNNGKQ